MLTMRGNSYLVSLDGPISTAAKLTEYYDDLGLPSFCFSLCDIEATENHKVYDPYELYVLLEKFGIDADSIIPAMLENKFIDNQIHNFFNSCDFFKGFSNYLRTCRQDKCPFLTNCSGFDIVSSSSSTGVHFKKAYAYPVGAKKNSGNVIKIVFEMRIQNLSDVVRHEEAMVCVPVGLITNFTVVKFNKWIKKINTDFKDGEIRRGKEQIADLKNKYLELKNE